jgi:hypothetical protein
MVIMSSSALPTRFGTALLLATLVLAGCSGGAKSASPSQLSSNAADYDGQSVSVTGTAKDPQSRTTRRGPMVRYQLCDTACINVVQFGDASVTDGSKITVSGFFRQSFGRVHKFSNVLIVGGHRPNS